MANCIRGAISWLWPKYTWNDSSCYSALHPIWLALRDLPPPLPGGLLIHQISIWWYINIREIIWLGNQLVGLAIRGLVIIKPSWSWRWTSWWWWRWRWCCMDWRIENVYQARRLRWPSHEEEAGWSAVQHLCTFSNCLKPSCTFSNCFHKEEKQKDQLFFPKVFPMSFLQRPIAISTTGRNYKTKHTRVWPPLYRSFLSFVGIWNFMQTRNSILVYFFFYANSNISSKRRTLCPKTWDGARHR